MRHLPKIITVILLVSFGFLSAFVSAGEAETVVLRAEAEVANDVIKLGDVLEDAENLPGDLRNLQLGNAPWPGRVRRVGPSLIELRVVSVGYDYMPFRMTGPEVCLVRRKTHEIEPDEITKVARDYLVSQLPDDAEEVFTEVVNSVDEVQLEDDNYYDLRPSHDGNNSLAGRVRIKVGVVQDGRQVAAKSVIFRVRLYRSVAVAARSIAISEPLSADAVTWKRRDVGDVRAQCVTDKKDLRDKLATRSISAGQIITVNMLKKQKGKVCVKPQQLVNLIVETETLRVVVRGRALQQGREGDWVKAVNSKTDRKVSGVVMGGGNIRVEM